MPLVLCSCMSVWRVQQICSLFVQTEMHHDVNTCELKYQTYVSAYDKSGLMSQKVITLLKHQGGVDLTAFDSLSESISFFF